MVRVSFIEFLRHDCTSLFLFTMKMNLKTASRRVVTMPMNKKQEADGGGGAREDRSLGARRSITASHHIDRSGQKQHEMRETVARK
jgi:hypothetical protein